MSWQMATAIVSSLSVAVLVLGIIIWSRGNRIKELRGEADMQRQAAESMRSQLRRILDERRLKEMSDEESVRVLLDGLMSWKSTDSGSE